jgi:hypothetical protein
MKDWNTSRSQPIQTTSLLEESLKPMAAYCLSASKGLCNTVAAMHSNPAQFIWVNREIREFRLRIRGASKKGFILAQILHTKAADFGFEIVSRSECLPFLGKNCLSLAHQTRRNFRPH